MVSIPKTFVPIPVSPLDSPRDWSHRFDQQQPPLKGEACFVIMLVSLRKRARWRPRTLDSVPPIVAMTGAGMFTWTRSAAAAAKDVAGFNANQLRQVEQHNRICLWACVGWGLAGYDLTVRPLVKGGGA